MFIALEMRELFVSATYGAECGQGLRSGIFIIYDTVEANAIKQPGLARKPRHCYAFDSS